MNAKAPTQTLPPASQSLDAAMQTMKPLLNANGEIDLSNLQIGERMQKFVALREQLNANLPLWDTQILTQFPPGVSFVLIPLIPEKDDAWHEPEVVTKLKLPKGHVEPSANFINKMGRIMGIHLDCIEDDVIDRDGIKMYSVRYNASLRLPNGELLAVPPEGKEQPLINSFGNVQAHIAESTRKKAQRNVYKAMFGMPTSMPAEKFYRPCS